MDLNGNRFAGYCFTKLFVFMCSSPSPSESTDAGGYSHHGGSDISRAVVGTGSWEEFLSAISPRQGLADSPVPSAGVSSHLSCQMTNQLLCDCAPSNTQKPDVYMGTIVFSLVFLFKY